MSKNLLILLMVLILAPNLGFGNKDINKTSSTYLNERYAFSLLQPAGFKRVISDNGDGVSLISPDETIKIAAWGSYNALDHSLNEEVAFVTKDLSLLEKKSWKEKNGYLLLIEDGDRRSLRLVVHTGDVIYGVLCTSPTALFDKHRPLFAQVINSFRIVSKPGSVGRVKEQRRDKWNQ